MSPADLVNCSTEPHPALSQILDFGGTTFAQSPENCGGLWHLSCAGLDNQVSSLGHIFL